MSFGRRTWDLEAAAERAKETKKVEEKVVKQVEYDFDQGLNQRTIVSGISASKRGKQFGFYCAYCDLTFKDNMQYLDHVNSKPHLIKYQQQTGIVAQREDDITLDDVRKRFEKLVKQRARTVEVKDVREKIASAEEISRERKLRLKEKLKLKKQKAVERAKSGRCEDV